MGGEPSGPQGTAAARNAPASGAETSGARVCGRDPTGKGANWVEIVAFD